MIEVEAKALGLSLNERKCEVIGLNPSNSSYLLWESASLQYNTTSLVDATLLGVPIFAGAGVDNVLSSKIDNLKILIGRLSFLPADAALFY